MKWLLLVMITVAQMVILSLCKDYHSAIKRIGQMKSRFCAKFYYYKPTHFHRTIPPNKIKQSLNFSVEFWQPFVSLTNLQKNSSTIICGPLLGILIELSNKLNYNLTYIPDLGNETLPWREFDRFQLNMVLIPFAPMNMIEEKYHNYIKLSRVLGDMPMVSILSAEMDSDIRFGALNSFNDIFIYCYLVFCMAIILATYFINLLWKMSLSELILNIIRCILRQPIPNFKNKCQRLLPSNVIWLTFFFNLFISNLLLTFYQFRPASDKIDSFQELAEHKNLRIFLFKGESSETILASKDHPFYADFRERFLLEDPKNEEMEDWHKKMAKEIYDEKMVMISDKYYLDFFYNSFRKLYPNLYRSQMNDVVLPYFLPLRNANPAGLNREINQLLLILSESGIYRFWIFETLYQNSLKEDRKSLEQTKESYANEFSQLKNDLDEFNVATLTLNEMESIFIILFAFLILAILTFVSEIVCDMLVKRYRRKAYLTKVKSSQSLTCKSTEFLYSNHKSFY